MGGVPVAMNAHPTARNPRTVSATAVRLPSTCPYLLRQPQYGFYEQSAVRGLEWYYVGDRASVRPRNQGSDDVLLWLVCWWLGEHMLVCSC